MLPRAERPILAIFFQNFSYFLVSPRQQPHISLSAFQCLPASPTLQMLTLGFYSPLVQVTINSCKYWVRECPFLHVLRHAGQGRVMQLWRESTMNGFQNKCLMCPFPQSPGKHQLILTMYFVSPLYLMCGLSAGSGPCLLCLFSCIYHVLTGLLWAISLTPSFLNPSLWIEWSIR